MMNGLGELRFDSLKVRLDFLRYSEESDWRKAIENPLFSAVSLRRHAAYNVSCGRDRDSEL